MVALRNWGDRDRERSERARRENTSGSPLSSTVCDCFLLDLDVPRTDLSGMELPGVAVAKAFPCNIFIAFVGGKVKWKWWASSSVSSLALLMWLGEMGLELDALLVALLGVGDAVHLPVLDAGPIHLCWFVTGRLAMEDSEVAIPIEMVMRLLRTF